MFKKKECKKCKSKMNDKYDFCPYCGARLENDEGDWGMLGKNDSTNNSEQFFNPMLGGISGSMITKVLGSMMKMLEKEMQKGMKNQNQPRTNFRLMINGKEIDMNNLQNGNPKTIRKVCPKKEIPSNIFSKENLKKFSNLPREEPLTNIRRLSDKVIYEIDLPEVKSLEDVSIIKLENSIEIKAIAKDKAYFKLIPINLPMISYSLSEDKLILELGVK